MTYVLSHREYLFNFSATGTPVAASGGSVSASVANAQIQAAIGVTSASTTATFSATANSGYIFVGWGTSSTATTYAPTNPYTVTVSNTTAGSTANQTLYAFFKPTLYFSAAANVGSVAGGTAEVALAEASVEGTPGTSSGSTTATFTATPLQGYEFVGWGTTATATSYESTANPYVATLNNTSPGSTLDKTLYAIFREKNIILDPASPSYEPGFCVTVTLARTLREGYSTLALPFATDVATLTGRSNEADWVAQLQTVTYNQEDGYTLYFNKVDGGAIAAGEPYVLHLGSEVVNPQWVNLNVPEAQATTMTATTGYGSPASPDGSSTYADWSMTSNFTAGKSMSGLYGIVNTAGGLQMGGSGSTLNAFTAYITPPAGSAGVKLRSAFVDVDGHTDYIEGCPATQQSPSAIYTLDGVRRQNFGRGIHLVRLPDGSVRKILH